MHKNLYIFIDRKTDISYVSSEMLGDFIRKQRKKRLITQERLASELGLSRSTYVQIELGKRELKVSEARKLAEAFDMSLGDFLNEREQPSPVIEIKWSREKKSVEKHDVRVSIPREKAEKFKQVLLYVLAKIGARPNIGQTALYKILYFIDFDYYEKYEEQLIGAKYIKNTYGPSPVIFAKIVEELEKEDKIERVKTRFHQYDQVKYLVNSRELNISSPSSRELEHINWEIRRLGDMTVAQISELSHLDTPWVVAEDREQLEYEHVFYRPQSTSVREYEEL